MPESHPILPSELPRIALISTHGYVAAVPPLGAADTGGQVVYVLELAKKFAQLGYLVDIWTRRFADQPEIDEVNERVQVIRVPCGGDAFIRKEDLWEFLPEWCENALKFIHQRGYVYRFINSHYWDAGMAGQCLGAALDVPHIHTPHSLGIWKKRQMEKDYPQNKASFEAQYNFTRRILEERRLYGDCDLVIATTPPQYDMLLDAYDVPSDKIRMVPPGYDDTRFFPVSAPTRETLRRRLGFEGNVILALGRLARNKGYDLLIEAFPLVAKRHPNAVLHLAVGGEETNARERTILGELRALATRTGFADRIRFGSFIPDAELPDYYRAADLFVLCSRYEPFGMTAIEAMASGTPTVVTVHGGLHRALSFGRHALFADPFDREDLGITMAKVFRHPRLKNRLSRMGAHKARSLFTWSGIAQQLLAVVNDPRELALAQDDVEWDEPWNDGD
ncbi:glycosyltransferase family 1 protein [Opitutaceae bacterium EW11]|nr:glycosyltransferase family 1 protein [Opitutaceae bacterium EW11]